MAIRENWEIFDCDCGIKFAICLEGVEELDGENVECPVCGCMPHSSFNRSMDMLTIAEELDYIRNGDKPEDWEDEEHL